MPQEEEQQAQQDNQFLKERKLPHVIYDNFKISGTGKALLDFNDLLRVQLMNDSVQGFDTKLDKVLLSMTKILDEEVLEKLHKKQLHFSVGLEPLMASYLRDTVQKGEAFCYSRLKGNGLP